MKEFIDYLSQRIEACKEEIAGLEKSGRQDDADFAKVRLNIYTICRTVTDALQDRPGAGAGAVKAQLERFRTEWSAALDRAREHDETRNSVVGEVRMEALGDVIAHFPEEEK
ncbi:MAG: hypothetical protein J6P48_03290 [Oscillospiraceae bacterium]|nr:hypothetical protein [Oscillospiraceae bacterium]